MDIFPITAALTFILALFVGAAIIFLFITMDFRKQYKKRNDEKRSSLNIELPYSCQATSIGRFHQTVGVPRKMSIKPEDVIDPPEQSPRRNDVEFTVRDTSLGLHPECVNVVHELLRRLGDQAIGSYSGLLTALDVLYVSKRAPEIYDAIIQGKITPDFPNFDPSLHSKPRENYVRGQICRNALEFIQALIAEQTKVQLTIALPEHLVEELTRKVELDRQLTKYEDANELRIDQLLRKALDQGTDNCIKR